METTFSDDPIFPALTGHAGAVGPADDPDFGVAARLDLDAAQRIAWREIFGRFLSPLDIRRATVLDRMRLLQVPFWRVEVSVDGFHVSFTSIQVGSGRIGIPIPLRSSRHESRVLMVCGRSSFPYEVQVPGRPAYALGGVPPLTAGAEELIPRSAGLPAEGELVEQDVPRELAGRTAQHALLRALEPASALYSKYEPSLGSMALVRYPVFYLRYRYDGRARRYAAEDCAVAISARTGKLIARRHPSGVRAAAGKLRRMLSLR